MAGKRSWDHKVTAVIPHKDTPELLICCIRGLQWQTEPPHIVIVDFSEKLPRDWLLPQVTGQSVELISAVGMQLRHPMEGMTWSYDAGIELCKTEFVYFTQPDVLLHNKQFLSWLTRICYRQRPVCGYESYDRGKITDEWPGMVNNVATLAHSETIWRLGIRWNFARSCRFQGAPCPPGGGWPDGETGFNYCLRTCGIMPYLIGREICSWEWQDENLAHARQATGSMNGIAPAGYREYVTELIASHHRQYLS